MSTIKTFHPDYSAFRDIQTMCRDLYAGEMVIKSKGETYLPSTSGMRLDGMLNGQVGYSDYQAYLKRAVLPGDFEDAVNTRMGLLYQKPPTIELPPQLEYLRTDADGKGMSLDALLVSINLAQLIQGRIGLALDTTVDKRLKIVTYDTQSIINWDDNDKGLQFVILNETGFELGPDLDWILTEKYRMLALKDGAYSVITEKADSSSEVIPELLGKSLNEVPFVFVNVTDNQPSPEKPPLSALGSLVLCIYRGEADYRQNLFMQGQDTLVIIGNVLNSQVNPAGVPIGTPQDSATRTGAGSRINVTENSDVKYVGVNSQGLPEQRQALEADRKRAESKAGELVNTSASGVESNAALQTRIASRTVTLNHIALSGARGLESILKVAARWSGNSEAEISVTPNLEFNKEVLVGTELKAYTEVNMLGGPLSLRSIHDLAVKKGLTTMTFEEEMAERDKERANG